MKRFVRHLTVMLVSTAMMTGVLTGCGKSENDGDRDISAKGRYIEESMELPVQEGEELLNMTRSEAGNPVLYAWQFGGAVQRYEYQDGDWEQKSLDWIDGLDGWQEIFLQEVHEIGDTEQIIWGIDADMKTHVARSRDGQSGEELVIPYLAKQGEFGFPVITELEIDGDGNYWLNNMYEPHIAVIDSASLELVEEIGCVQSTSNELKYMSRAGNGDIAVNTEAGVFTIYGPDLKEKGTFDTKQKERARLCNVDKNWYLISQEGIARIVPGNETSEVIMDGSMGEMSSSLSYVTGFEAGQEDDFYVVYRQEKTGTTNLVHYVYDEEALAVPEHTLRVFGLSENQTVQDAILEFQKAHPDVKVEFETSGKGEDITVDDIRTLNAELLSGNGADVLLLDGLSAKAYIEKGILEDLTGLLDEMLSQDEYLESILKNTAQKDGKVYGMPVRFSVPIVYGDEEAKKALGSLKELEAYVDAHPEESIVGLADRSYIRDFLFQMYQDEVFKEDLSVDQEKLAALLKLETKIAANARTELFDEFGAGEMAIGTVSKIFQQGMFTNAGSTAILNHPKSIATDRISCIQDMMVPYTIMRRMELTPDTLKDFYIPGGIAGINQGSKQKETAEEFIKFLFSKEVQEKPLEDGLPVLVSALDSLKGEVDSEYARSVVMTSIWSVEGEGDIEVQAGYPTVEETADLIDKCRTLSRPVIQDCFIWDCYQTEADACLEGNTDAETAARNVAGKADTYLAE